MNRTTKINILAYASEPDKNYKYEGDLVEYNGKRYWVSLMNETVEFVGEITERYLMMKKFSQVMKDADCIEEWSKLAGITEEEVMKIMENHGVTGFGRQQGKTSLQESLIRKEKDPVAWNPIEYINKMSQEEIRKMIASNA